MCGEEFVTAMIEHGGYEHIPVIMLSSVDETDLQDRMSKTRISTFLTKPARLNRLHEAIGDALIESGPVNELASIEAELEAKPIVKPMITDVRPMPTQGLTIAPAQFPSVAPASVTPLQVLIAEDEATNQIYAKYMMQELGLSVGVVQNGKEAVAHYQAAPPKIILMDIAMPQMDGYQATQAIREFEAANNLPRVPIVAVTAHCVSDEEQKCLAVGMDDFLSKPLSACNLKRMLAKHGIIGQTSVIGMV